jgi:hypothetical protein
LLWSQGCQSLGQNSAPRNVLKRRTVPVVQDRLNFSAFMRERTVH